VISFPARHRVAKVAPLRPTLLEPESGKGEFVDVFKELAEQWAAQRIPAQKPRRQPGGLVRGGFGP
jgi:acyl-coenzyme A thioesterase PaaI-like protein